MSTVTPECGGRCAPPGCDACHHINAGYGPPWGWSLDDWDEYVEEQLMLMVMSPGYIDDTGHAWCVMVLLITTAAMAILHTCPACNGRGRRLYARELEGGCDECDATGFVRGGAR